MDNKTILNKVSEIENDAYNLKDISKVVETIKCMSTVSDITTLQIFVRGLAVTVEDTGKKLNTVWHKAYRLEQELEKELAEPEPTIDEEVTADDLPFK
jgi:hypothetical protein